MVQEAGLCVQGQLGAIIYEPDIENRTEFFIEFSECLIADCPEKTILTNERLEKLELEYWIFDSIFQPLDYDKPIIKVWKDEGWMQPLTAYTIWSSVYITELEVETEGYWKMEIFPTFDSSLAIEKTEQHVVPKTIEDGVQKYFYLVFYAGSQKKSMKRQFWDL